MLILRNATLAGGATAVDVTIDGDRISAIEPHDSTAGAGAGAAAAAESVDGGQDRTVDLGGFLLTSAFAEPHAHLDKALTADLVLNPGGDLIGAIEAWLAYRGTISKADFAARAEAAARLGLANGCTAIRTHVDIGPDIGVTAVEALVEVKTALAPLLDLQLVGLIGGLTGPTAAEGLAVLRDALDIGLDVVGGVPHREQDPVRAIEIAFDVAAERGCPVDLHADETLDPRAHDLATMAERVLSTGFEPLVTASHCVALGMMAEVEQQRISQRTAEAGIGIVTLPQTNLYLQARDRPVAPPRGLTSLAALQRAGVTVAGGGDNLQDPFCIVGRGDPMETASLLVMAGHLSATEAYRMVSDRARLIMGLEPVRIEVGGLAELVAVDAPTERHAIAAGPPARVVIHRGTLVHDGRR